MTRFISFLCVLAILFSLCACKSGNNVVNESSATEDSLEEFMSFDDMQSSDSSINISSENSDNSKITGSSSECSGENNTSPDGITVNSQTPTAGLTSSNGEDIWRKMVALTFDDGPQLHYGKLLELLKEKNVKSTFFLRGDNMEAYPETVRQIVDDGHIIGWHSYDHSLNGVSKSSIEKDFAKIYPILSDIGLENYKIKYLRMPGGNQDGNVLDVAREHDMRIINWSNYKFNDDKDQSVSAENRIKPILSDNNSVKNGTVFLIHPRDNGEIIKGIGLLIDELRKQGYEFVTVEVLLKRQGGGVPGVVYKEIY